MESTVILDWGSHSFKAGTATAFPSEEGPQIVLPSAVRSNSDAPAIASDLNVSTNSQQVVEQGRVASWPGFEALTHFCLYNQVRRGTGADLTSQPRTIFLAGLSGLSGVLQLGWVAGDEGNLLLSQPLFLPRVQ